MSETSPAGAAEWTVVLTFEDGHTEDLTVAEDVNSNCCGCFDIPEGVVSVGPFSMPSTPHLLDPDEVFADWDDAGLVTPTPLDELPVMVTRWGTGGPDQA